MGIMEKAVMRTLLTALMCLTFTFQLTACSSEDEQLKGVLTDEQERALQKAEDLEQSLMDAQKLKLEELDSQKP